MHPPTFFPDPYGWWTLTLPPLAALPLLLPWLDLPPHPPWTRPLVLAPLGPGAVSALLSYLRTKDHPFAAELHELLSPLPQHPFNDLDLRSLRWRLEQAKP